MGFAVFVIAGGEGELKVGQETRGPMDDLEVLRIGACDNSHHISLVQGLEDVANPIHQEMLLRK